MHGTRSSAVHSKKAPEFVRERKDPAKMAHTRMALSRRGPSVKPASSKADAGAYCRLQVRKLQQAVSRQARPGSSVAAHTSSTLSTPRRLRRSGSARSGLEPEPCGHRIVGRVAHDDGSPNVMDAAHIALSMEPLCTGKSKTLPK